MFILYIRVWVLILFLDTFFIFSDRTIIWIKPGRSVCLFLVIFMVLAKRNGSHSILGDANISLLKFVFIQPRSVVVRIQDWVLKTRSKRSIEKLLWYPIGSKAQKNTWIASLFGSLLMNLKKNSPPPPPYKKTQKAK